VGGREDGVRADRCSSSMLMWWDKDSWELASEARLFEASEGRERGKGQTQG
jgi:hypothetical protein